MHCSIVVPALHRCVATPHTNATLWFHRCSGGFQRPALMQHRGSSAALVVSDSTLGFRPLVDSSASFLCKISAPASQWCFSATYFYAVFGFNAALTDSNGPFLRSLAAPAPHGWTPAFHAHATSCEQRSCTRDTSKQVLRRSLTACSQRQGATAVSAKSAPGFP